MLRARTLVLLELGLLVSMACRAGAAARGAPLPQPTSIAQWVAIAVFVLGLWWLVLKILRG